MYKRLKIPLLVVMAVAAKNDKRGAVIHETEFDIKAHMWRIPWSDGLITPAILPLLVRFISRALGNSNPGPRLYIFHVDIQAGSIHAYDLTVFKSPQLIQGFVAIPDMEMD